jgi:predicted Holliday junction resolvase-like endonuclease
MILLDATASQYGTVFFIALILFLVILFVVYNSGQQKENKYKNQINEKDLLVQKMASDTELLKAELQLNVNTLAQAEFEKFRANELEQYQKVLRQAAVETAQKWLAEWKIVEEKKLREDAVKRSMSVNLGKITEHLVPFSEYFKQFNPKDARFIGSPIDLIVFDGASDEKEAISIHFVEIKTGTSGLSPLQRKIKVAIENKNIFWYQINMVDFKWDGADNQQEPLQIESSIQQ